jgi:nucleotide-binding universal stress UspA family protein
MVVMKKILVPTDFSATSEKAFRFALYLAGKSKGSVILYHAYTPVESTFVGTEEEREEYNQQEKKDAQKRLDRLKNHVMGENNAVPVETVVDRTPLKYHMLAFASKHQADLVVMGTHGASGIKKVVIGSVASDIAKDSGIPLLLVPEEYEWKEPEQIVFATDYGDYEKEALEKTIEWSRICGTKLTLVHLCSSDSGKEQQEMQVFQTFADAIQKKYDGHQLQFKAIPCKELAESIEHLDEKIAYDILVMVRRNKNLLQQLFSKSFTKKMAYATHFPLLIIPAKIA